MAKLKAMSCFSETDFNQFEGEVQATSYEKALAIAWRCRDESGHSQVVSLKCIPFYGRLASELQSRETKFKTVSDVYRTALNLGMKDILNALKRENRIGDELDDLILSIDKLEKEAKADEAYRHWETTLKRIPRSLGIYRSDPEVFMAKVKAYEKEIESIGNPFWRNRLLKKFRQMLMSIDDGRFHDGNSWDEEDGGL